jgi:Flp pilus assembly protein TadD
LQLKPKFYDPEFKEAAAQFHLATSYEALGNKVEATQHLLAAFQLEPKNAKFEKKILAMVSPTQ